MATVQVEEMEYKALMLRLEALEKMVGNEVKSIPHFAALVKSKPCIRVQPIGVGVPEFRFECSFQSDAWNAFLALAKSYLQENDRFYRDTTSTYGCNGRGDIGRIYADKVRVIAKVPIEKQLLAAQMVSEMVDVYNKYYVEAHKKVIYKPSQDKDPVIVKVIYDPNEV